MSNILDLLKGKKMIVETDMGVMVEMEIKEVEEWHRSRELEPATAQNDWWPKEETWTEYIVHFANGKKKTYSSISQINVHE